MHSGQLQCSSVIPQNPHFEQQKYSPTGLHSAISPFGALNSEPHLPSFRYAWFSSIVSSFSKDNENLVGAYSRNQMKIILENVFNGNPIMTMHTFEFWCDIQRIMFSIVHALWTFTMLRSVSTITPFWTTIVHIIVRITLWYVPIVKFKRRATSFILSEFQIFVYNFCNN